MKEKKIPLLIFGALAFCLLFINCNTGNDITPDEDYEIVSIETKPFNEEANNFVTNHRDPAITFERLSINDEIEFITAYRPGSSKKPLYITIHGGGGRKEGELWNLNGHAQAGFFAIALDVAAHGDSPKGPMLSMDAWVETVKYIDTLIEYCKYERTDVNADKFVIGGVSMGGTITLLYGTRGKYRPAVLCPEIGSPDFAKILNGRANGIMDKGAGAGEAPPESVREKAIELSPIHQLEKFYGIPMYARFGEKDFDAGAEGAITFVNALKDAGQTIQKLFIIPDGLHGEMPDHTPFPEMEPPRMEYIKQHVGL